MATGKWWVQGTRNLEERSMRLFFLPGSRLLILFLFGYLFLQKVPIIYKYWRITEQIQANAYKRPPGVKRQKRKEV